ncbi:hypothetical protein JB92DRAFT_2675075, partial [Gautieria morchelliformis]
SRKGCFKCGNRASLSPACSSDQRLCYNCRQPGHESPACPQPRTVAAKQCYSCGGVGHIQAECPSLRVQGGGQKCYTCGRFGHIARASPAFASRAPPPGRGLNTASLPPVKCFRCGGLNHMSRSAFRCSLACPYCLAAPGTTVADQTVVSNGGAPSNKDKICYKCSQQGHV